MYGFALFLSVFLATAVEAVEALTIVLAAGTARDWKSAFRGVYAGFALLAVIIAIFGPAISRAPISVLRIIVGGLLLVFGLQWLRKAILRASGYKALHDEEKIYQEELKSARAAKKESRIGVDDWYAFTLSFKGVVLEGLEIVFIVLTFGTIQKDVGLASIAALSAVALTVIAGFVIHKPLSRVPENTMKFVVGILLTSFGIFWGAEGSGAHWPGDNWAILCLVLFIALLSIGYAKVMGSVLGERREARKSATKKSATGSNELPIWLAKLKAFALFWYDFVIGDDWTVAVTVFVTFFVTKWLAGSAGHDWWILPITVALALAVSLARATQRVHPNVTKSLTNL